MGAQRRGTLARRDVSHRRPPVSRVGLLVGVFAIVSLVAARQIVKVSSDAAAVPTNQPTDQPAATGVASSDDPVGPNREVTASVTDRPGVPDELRELYWIAQDVAPAQAGQLGTTARIRFTKGELPIAAAHGLVATVANGPQFARERASLIRVWDVRTGKAVLETTTALWVEYGAFAGDYLFWGGWDVDKSGAGENAIYPGGGLWAVNVAAGGGPILVVPPEPTVKSSGQEPLGQGTRGPFAVSPSGATLASPVYLDDGRVGRSDIVDVASMSVVRTVSGYVCAASDSAAILCPDGGDLIAVAFKDGAESWHVNLAQPDSDSQAPFVYAVQAFDARVIVQYSYQDALVIVAIDVTSGTATELLRDTDGPSHYLAPSLSSADHLVLLPAVGVSPSLELRGGKVFAAVLDAQSLNVTADAFAIGAP